MVQLVWQHWSPKTVHQKRLIVDFFSQLETTLQLSSQSLLKLYQIQPLTYSNKIQQEYSIQEI